MANPEKFRSDLDRLFQSFVIMMQDQQRETLKVQVGRKVDEFLFLIFAWRLLVWMGN